MEHHDWHSSSFCTIDTHSLISLASRDNMDCHLFNLNLTCWLTENPSEGHSKGSAEAGRFGDNHFLSFRHRRRHG
jgi:hypothetical protein